MKQRIKISREMLSYVGEGPVTPDWPSAWTTFAFFDLDGTARLSIDSDDDLPAGRENRDANRRRVPGLRTDPLTRRHVPPDDRPARVRRHDRPPVRRRDDQAHLPAVRGPQRGEFHAVNDPPPVDRARARPEAHELARERDRVRRVGLVYRPGG